MEEAVSFVLEGKEDKGSSKNEEKFTSVSSSIMLNLPTSKLDKLREVFERNPNLEHNCKRGLNLRQYLIVLVECMSIGKGKDLVDCVANLVDFFNFVDVNGDGYMEWNEFVTFIIEQCSFVQENQIMEKFALKREVDLNLPGMKSLARCTKYFEVFGNILQGEGSDVHFWGLNFESNSWLTCNFKLQLTNRNRSMRDIDSLIHTIDMTYWTSNDTLIILRSDFCLEFCHFLSKSNFCADNLINRSIVPLCKSFVKIVIRDECSIYHARLFAVGPMNDIYSWDLRVDENSGNVGIFNEILLTKHSDFVNDVLVVKNDLHEYVVSASLDRFVNLWDLSSLRYKSSRTGHTAGIQCLAFDGHSMVISGGFDHKILGWDLDNVLDVPTWEFQGHKTSIVKIVALKNPDRCFSLDESGELKYWLSSVHHQEHGNDRLIDSIPAFRNDRLRSFEVFPKAGSVFNSIHGIILCAVGRKRYVYSIEDTTVRIGPPRFTFFSKSVSMIISLHRKDLIFRHALTADVVMHVHQNEPDEEYMVGVLCTGDKKIAVGTSKGVVSIFKCLNGAHLRDIDTSISPVTHLSSLYHKNIVAMNDNGDLVIFDEESAQCLRTCSRSFDSEIKLFSASSKLGMIATFDNNGILNIFDYEFCTLLYSIDKLAKYNISQIVFMEPSNCLLMKTLSSFFLLMFNDKFLNFAQEVDIVAKSKEVNPIVELPIVNGQTKKRNEENTFHKVGETTAFSLCEMERSIELPREVKCMDFAILNDENNLGLDQKDKANLKLQDRVYLDPSVLVCCGTEDGIISIYDVTNLLRGCNAVTTRDNEQQDICYDSKRLKKNILSLSEMNKKSIRIDDIARTRSSELSVPLILAWRAHKATVNFSCVVGHHHDILSCSEDQAIYLWEMKTGVLKGILTQGQHIDRHVTPRWTSMVDEGIQERLRKAKAGYYIRDLSLEQLALQHTEVSYELEKSLLIPSEDTSRTVKSLMEDYSNVNDRNKLIGQLAGKVTHQRSDIAIANREEIMSRKKNSTKKESSGNRKKKKVVGRDRYFESCSMSTGFINCAGEQDSQLKRRQKLNACEFELLQMQNSDPNNWEITSINRQQSMYENLYEEYNKGGQIRKNQFKVLETKANSLSPEGDFHSFYSTMVNARIEGTLSTVEVKHL